MYIDGADASARNHFISPQVESLTGYRPVDFKLNPTLWREIVHADDLDVMNCAISRNLAGEPADSEYRVTHRDGREVWLLDSSTPLLGSDGRVTEVRGFLADVTARHEVELALRRREEELRTAND